MPQGNLELVRKGFTKTGESKCRTCQAPIDFYTTGNGKKTPPMNAGTATNHFDTCGKVIPIPPKQILPSQRVATPPSPDNDYYVNVRLSRPAVESLLAKLQEAMK